MEGDVAPSGGTAIAPAAPIAAPPVTVPAPIWASSLSDEALRSDPTVSRYKTLDDAARGLIEANKKLGERPQGVTPLNAESTPEQITAYRKAMGIPDTPDGYQVQMPTYPEGITRSEEQLSTFRALAHEIHLTPAQLEKIFAFDAQRVASDVDAANTAALKEAATSLDKLKERFGPLAEQKLLQAREYMRRRFGEDGTDEIEAMGLGNNPTLIEILAESAVLTGHDKFVLGDGRGGTVTKEAALKEILQLRQQRVEGKVSEQDFKVQFDRLAPIAYSEPGDRR